MDFQVISPLPVSWNNYWQYSPTNKKPKSYTNSRGKWPADNDRSYIKHDPDIDEARALIAAIFLQALRDSQTTYRECVTRQSTIDQYSARQWLTRNWTRDTLWLDYLDLDPLWFGKYIASVKAQNWPQVRYDMRFLTFASNKSVVNALGEAEQILTEHFKTIPVKSGLSLSRLAQSTGIRMTTLKEGLVNLHCKGICKFRFHPDQVVRIG